MAEVADDDFKAAPGDVKGKTSEKDRINGKYGDDMNNVQLECDGMKREGRGCTDILCLIVFLAFIGAMGYATFYGFHNGDIERLIAPIAG
jgi:hypothetical protein